MCTGINLAQAPIEPIREMVATIGLEGLDTVAKIGAAQGANSWESQQLEEAADFSGT